MDDDDDTIQRDEDFELITLASNLVKNESKRDILFNESLNTLFSGKGGIFPSTNDNENGERDLVNIGEWLVLLNYCKMAILDSENPIEESNRLIDFSRIELSSDTDIIVKDDDTSSEGFPPPGEEKGSNDDTYNDIHVFERLPNRNNKMGQILDAKAIVKRAESMSRRSNQEYGKVFLKYLIYNTLDVLYGRKETWEEKIIDEKGNEVSNVRSWILFMKTNGFREYLEAGSDASQTNGNMMADIISESASMLYSPNSKELKKILTDVLEPFDDKDWFTLSYMNDKQAISDMLLEYSLSMITDMDIRVFCYVIGSFLTKRKIPLPLETIRLLKKVFPIELSVLKLPKSDVEELVFRPSQRDAGIIEGMVNSLFNLKKDTRERLGIDMEEIRKFVMYENRNKTKALIGKYISRTNVLPLNIMYDSFAHYINDVSYEDVNTLESISKLTFNINNAIQRILYIPYVRRVDVMSQQSGWYGVFNSYFTRSQKLNITRTIKLRDNEIRKDCLINKFDVIIDIHDFKHQKHKSEKEKREELNAKNERSIQVRLEVKRIISKTTIEDQRNVYIEINEINRYLTENCGEQNTCHHITFTYNTKFGTIPDFSFTAIKSSFPNENNAVIAVALVVEKDKTISVYTMEYDANKKRSDIKGAPKSRYFVYVYNPSYEPNHKIGQANRANLVSFIEKVAEKLNKDPSEIYNAMAPDAFAEMALKTENVIYLRKDQRESDIFFIMWYAECCMKGLTQKMLFNLQCFGYLFVYITLDYAEIILNNIKKRQKKMLDE
jgi:hypothetical protein